MDTEARWLTQRIATTHDLHHVVSGFGTSAAGENGVLAITATQIGFNALPFATARWEDGWELPVAEWRQRLGVTLPADNEPYGLHPS
jgi:ubiquinone biosynthesis protein COQ4